MSIKDDWIKVVVTEKFNEVVDRCSLIDAKHPNDPYYLCHNSSAIGDIGHQSVCLWLGIPYTPCTDERGDGGVDIWYKGWPINVKTLSNGHEALAETEQSRNRPGRLLRGVVVFVHWGKQEPTAGRLVGWEFAETILTWPIKKVKLVNHYAPYTSLLPMHIMDAVLASRPYAKNSSRCR